MLMGKDFTEWSCKEREAECYTLGVHDIRRWYQRDIDQITHSTCFRKLQRKSQLLSEKDPRSRSRLIHTIEVSRIAMEISEKLGLSKEVTEAICLAHDIGTSPYGCIGNSFLSDHVKQEFSHEMAGAYMLLRMSQKETDNDDFVANIETLLDVPTSSRMKQIDVDFFPRRLFVSRCTDDKNEQHYYLHHISPEIVDGVLNHGEHGSPNTLEGQVVQFADNIAYLSQDIEDLITTNIISKSSYTKYSAMNRKNLQYTPKPTGQNPTPSQIESTWHEIEEDSSIGSLRDAFSETRGRRIAAFISRFVNFNLKQLELEKLSYRKSIILNKDIPVLEKDSGMRFIIDFIWAFIEQQYKKPLINTSNCIQAEKMKQLWEIISSKEFASKNTSYANFMKEISSSSLFSGCTEEWNKAFFVSHLSWFDVDIIIDSFHERNNTFELDISY